MSCRRRLSAGTKLAAAETIKETIMRRSVFCTLLALFLFGCAAAQPRQRMTWYHPNLDGQATQAQFVIDQGQCQALAMNSIAVPPPPAFPTFNSQGPTTSQIQMNSTSGQTYYGQITTQPMQQGWVPSGPLAGALAGQQYGAAMAQYEQAQQARNNLFNSCMYRQGWRLRAE